MFGIEGFKLFIIDNDQDIINELLYNCIILKMRKQIKSKIETLHHEILCWIVAKNSHKTKDQLTDTAQKLFHLLEQFAKFKKPHCMNLLIIESQIQGLVSPNDGHFQLYVYKNSFHPDEKSKILSHETLNKSTLEIIINEFFSSDINENEHIIKNL